MKTKLMSVDYLGFTAMDKRFSTSMLPWILLEIRRRGTREKLCLGVENGSLQAFDINFELQFTHKLSNIMRFTQVQSSPTEFLYLVKDSKEYLLYCYLFQAATVEEVTELFGHMKELAPHGGSLQAINKNSNSGSDPSISVKSVTTTKILPPNIRPPVATNKGFNPTISPASSAEYLPNGSMKSAQSSNIATSKSYTNGLNKSGTSVSNESNTSSVPLVRSVSNTSNLTSLGADISPSNSHFFEVLYIGKIKVSHKKVPDTLIDEALGKFQQYEVEKIKAAQMRRNSLLSTQTDSSNNDLGSLESLTPHNVKKVEFAPLPLPYKKETNEGKKCDKPEINKIQDGLMSPSLTPLETLKHFFENDEELEDDSNVVEKEFDKLSSERVQQTNTEQNSLPKPLVLNKKSFPVALEPNILILNTLPNETKNLATLTEDENESSNQVNICDTNLSNKVNMTELNVNKNSIDNEIKTSDILLSNENIISNISKEKLKRLNSESNASSLSETRDLFDCNQEEQLVNLLKNKTLPENKYFARDRSASIGTLNLHKTPITQLIGDQNRTMLFQVGRSDLRLISPDRKQVLLHKQLRDVASCVQGVSNREHFGFICREPDMECFVGYVFKCQSEGVSSDVVGAITQAFVAHAEYAKQGKEKSPLLSCEHCPMVWYHKLCQELEGMNEKRIHTTILKRIDQLGEEEQDQIMTKYQGGTEDLYEVGEHNAFLMMLLRAHCEAKQQRHVHDTAENRSEFLNQYLGGGTIFMKAKRSLSSSFDHLLKRKASKDDFNFKDVMKKESSPINHSITPTRETGDNNNGKINSTIPKIKMPSNSDNSSIGPDITLNLVQNGQEHEQSPSAQLKSPMMDIFMKLGSGPTTKSHLHEKNMKKQNDGTESGDFLSDRSNNQGSWRQAIFNRVAQAGTLLEESESNRTDSDDIAAATTGDLLRRPPSFSNLNQAYARKRNREELRDLWKKGINQAILLIRMEKENARLRARQEVSAVKRIKLEYEDIGGCANENSKVWDTLTAHRDSRISTRVDSQMLLQAIRHGVPRAKRGEVWYFLAEQFCLRQPPPDIKNFPNYSVPYESLLKQLTSHQHAILIDLGRTFPNHTYFSSPMGPGQLALFNLLKAYSLLDPEVGYCQGLSFVAGVLLLHLDEAEAFLMLRHLMFRRGLRRQYLPDMIALQIQLYQLSRLLKDHIPELYDKFDEYDVSPTLYAAPWILTIFTSQFPLGFVTRVFDLLFLESSEVIFRVAIALLDIHKDGIMLCESFEEIMEYLKYKMPNIDKPMLDKVIKMTFTLDFSRQLNEYQVEYNVLQEEMAAIAPKMEALNHLEIQNKRLQDQNRQLMEQLEVSASKVSACQVSQRRLDNQVKNLEQTVAMLARYIGTTYDRKIELPNDVRKLCQQVQQNDRKTLGVLGQKLGHSFSSKFSTTDFTNNNKNSFPNSSAFSEESSSDPDEKNSADIIKKPSILKTGLSTPNLFSKEPNKSTQQSKSVSIETDAQALEKKRQYLSMKKSQSCNAGLMVSNKNETQKLQKQNSVASTVQKVPTNLKGYPLRVLDENSEYDDKPKSSDNFESIGVTYLSDTSSIASDVTNLSGDEEKQKKSSKFFANSHELIRKEKLQAEQLKRDFDENLRKLDARLSPNKSIRDESKPDVIMSPSFVTGNTSVPLEKNINLALDSKNLSGDSGLGTPVSPPNDKLSPEHNFTTREETKNNTTIVNHPLIGCDVDIKFEVQTTKLKSLRPNRFGNPFSNRTSSIESSDSRN